ncbi:MAG: cell division protein ZapA, partial [Nitrospinae bacterium]|nr:cell division protein ZapA [Nitrospinota bacterium]
VPLKASILAALNIADELHRLKAEQDSITRHIEERTKVLSGLFET